MLEMLDGGLTPEFKDYKTFIYITKSYFNSQGITFTQDYDTTTYHEYIKPSINAIYTIAIYKLNENETHILPHMSQFNNCYYILRPNEVLVAKDYAYLRFIKCFIPFERYGLSQNQLKIFNKTEI